MPSLQQHAELDKTLKLAAQNAATDTSSLRLAEQFYDDNLRLVEPLVQGWVIERLTALIRKLRVKPGSEDGQQLVFEEVLGFHHLPVNLKTRAGKKVPRNEATLRTFRTLATRLRKRRSPALAETLRAVELMERYSRKQRGITWGEVLEKEAARAKR